MFFRKGGLVAFDGQQVVRSKFEHQLSGRSVLGVERVQGDLALGQIKIAEEFARHRDLIGLGVDQRVAKVKLAGHTYHREDGITRALARVLAIDRNELPGRDWAAELGLDFQQNLVKSAGI